ncbi:MAG: thioredoxin family protein [Candidatus Lokiarchaeia archaeon]
MIVIELFYSNNCLYCPAAKKIVEESVKEIEKSFKENIMINEINVGTKTGQEKAKFYKIQGVPTIAINGTVSFVGLPPSTQALVREIRKFIDGNQIYV